MGGDSQFTSDAIAAKATIGAFVANSAISGSEYDMSRLAVSIGVRTMRQVLSKICECERDQDHKRTRLQRGTGGVAKVCQGHRAAGGREH